MSKSIIQKTDKNGHIILLPETVFGQVDDLEMCSKHFEAHYWQSENRITGESKGRYTTYFINPIVNVSATQLKENWVLRHYYRGGLVAKFIKDSYLYSGLENTRCYRELALLQQMIALDLPVPHPIAARVIQRGLFYRADLLMQKISATDLVALLISAPLESAVWQSIGKTVASFHHHGIDHADLNAHNIMLDAQNKVWLIDFDRCSKKEVSKDWQQKNIERLHRSFKKESGLHKMFNFNDEHWKSFLKGYGC